MFYTSLIFIIIKNVFLILYMDFKGLSLYREMQFLIVTNSFFERNILYK